MNETPIDNLTRLAAHGISRRGSMMTMGSAALAALTAPAAATSKGKKRNRSKTCGKTCQKKERKRCTTDAAACFNTALPRCGSDLDCLGIFEICCDTCSANGFFSCLLAQVPDATALLG